MDSHSFSYCRASQTTDKLHARVTLYLGRIVPRCSPKPLLSFPEMWPQSSTTLEQISWRQAGHHQRRAKNERVQYFSLTRISSCVTVAPCRPTCTDTMYAAVNTKLICRYRICLYSCDLGYSMQNFKRLMVYYLSPANQKRNTNFPRLCEDKSVCVCARARVRCGVGGSRYELPEPSDLEVGGGALLYCSVAYVFVVLCSIRYD